MTTPPEPPKGDSLPDRPDGSGEPGEPGASDDPAISVGPADTLPSHKQEEQEGERKHGKRRWLRVLAASTAMLVLALAGGTWYLYQRLNGNITTDTATEAELRVHASERPSEGPTKAENILLIGSDNRGDGNEQYGKDSGTQRSDTTILLHLSADRSSATAVSIPRDLMAHVPSCQGANGTTTAARFEQFNWAFEQGGAACTIRTVEDMTGIRIDHHLIVDFTGFKKMVNAVGGVDVCVPEPVHDPKAHLTLPAGRQKLNGEQALGYVRARYSIGDGSDTERMDRQQDFLASLVKKVRSNGVLLNPVKLYPLLSAATSSLTADPGLDSLKELYTLAHSIQRTPTGAVSFLTLPQEPYVQDRNRDQLQQPAADQLFAALRDDQAVNVTGDAPAGTPSDGSTVSPTGSPTATPTSPSTTGTGNAPTTPTYRGTTADRDICGKAR